MNYNDEQLEIINVNHPRIVVLASAAAGKSTLTAERIHRIVREGADPKKIVVFSFTNMAAHSIREKLSDIEGIYVGTIHGYANHILMTGGVTTHEYLKEGEFDELFNLVKENPDCVPEIDYLFLDEAQDTNQDEIDFCLNSLHPKNWMVIGDIRQCIYGFAGSEPEIITGLTDDPNVLTLSANTNYRCGTSILQYAKNIINRCGRRYYDTSTCGRMERGFVEEIDNVSEAIDIVAADGDFKNWFILCRTNAQIWQVQAMLADKNIPSVTFKQGDLTPELLKERMDSDSVKVLTMHSSKGLERNKVIIIGANFWSIEERCLAYVGATRARDYLIWVDNAKPKKYGNVKGYKKRKPAAAEMF